MRLTVDEKFKLHNAIKMAGLDNGRIVQLMMVLDTDEYVEHAVRTESPVTMALLGRMNSCARALHALMGLQTEVGELTDNFKKHIFYDKPLDETNILEESGDLLWYMALLFDEYKLDFVQVMERNIAKLRARYPEKFDSSRAITRDLEQEQKALERKES